MELTQAGRFYMPKSLLEKVTVTGPINPQYEAVLSQEALAFLAKLHNNFNARRLDLLEQRQKRQQKLNEGDMPAFLKQTSEIREDPHWKVAPTPPDLLNRRVEITGPTERKMMINALNSGANVFMADFEDALSPTWSNVVEGQSNLTAAIDRTLTFASPEGKQYTLKDKIATLMVRPRGWHLPEKHVLIDGKAISGSLFDFGLYFFHNARRLIEKRTGPYFYLPKLESHLEARLWNDVFNFSQDELKIPRRNYPGNSPDRDNPCRI